MRFITQTLASQIDAHAFCTSVDDFLDGILEFGTLFAEVKCWISESVYPYLFPDLGRETYESTNLRLELFHPFY